MCNLYIKYKQRRSNDTIFYLFYYILCLIWFEYYCVLIASQCVRHLFTPTWQHCSPGRIKTSSRISCYIDGARVRYNHVLTDRDHLPIYGLYQLNDYVDNSHTCDYFYCSPQHVDPARNILKRSVNRNFDEITKRLNKVWPDVLWSSTCCYYAKSNWRAVECFLPSCFMHMRCQFSTVTYKNSTVPCIALLSQKYCPFLDLLKFDLLLFGTIDALRYN